MLKPGRYSVLTFHRLSGECPFDAWIASLDSQNRQRILARVERMRNGQFGDHKKISHQIYELRLFFGPGYRVYFGERRSEVIIILAGGDKSTQQRDIKKAKDYWKAYLERNL
jgi:putative addiction module killer protein